MSNCKEPAKCPDCGQDVYGSHQCRDKWVTWTELITDPRINPVPKLNLNFQVDFSDTNQMAEDCWLFLTDETMPEVATIKKEAFLHEVRAMIESARQHALKHKEDDVQEWREECDRLAKVAEHWQGEYYKLNPPYRNPKLDNL